MLSHIGIKSTIVIELSLERKNEKMKRIIPIILTAVIIGSVFAGCGSSSTSASASPSSGASGSASPSVSGSITAAGSSALAPLVQAAADEFKKTNTGVSITVNAGGSGTGLTQVSQQSIDIGDSDVAAETKLTADQAKALVDHKVCVIGVAAVVNPDVTVTNLTTDQLVSIFTGKVTNWKDVGGADEAITVVGRPSSSGTRALFKQYALKNNEEMTTTLQSDDSGTLLSNISSTKGAIGYLALSYLVNANNVKTVSIDGVKPSLENIYSGSYKCWGDEHMYTYGDAKGATKAFLDYMVSDKFSAKMEGLGYGVSAKMKATH